MQGLHGRVELGIAPVGIVVADVVAAFHHPAVHDHRIDGAQVGDVLKRVLVDDDDVGELAGLHRADLFTEQQHFGRPPGGALDDLHRGHAGLDEDGDLVVQVLARHPGRIGVGARRQASAGVDEHLVEPQRVLKSIHLALPGGLLAHAPGPSLLVEGQRRLPAGRRVVGHEVRVRLVEERAVARLELSPARRVAPEVGHEGRRQRGIVGHQALDECPGAVVVHVGVHVQPVARVVRLRRRIGDRGPDARRMGQVVRGSLDRLPWAVHRAVGAREDGGAGAVGFLDAGDVVLHRQRSVVEHQRVGAGLDEGPGKLPGLVHGVRVAGRGEDGFKPRAAVGDPVESRNPGVGARCAQVARMHGIPVRDGDLPGIAHVDGRGDAVVEHDLAVVPAIADLRVPQTRQDELACGVDHRGPIVRGRGVSAGDALDPVAVDNHDGALHRRAAVAVDKGAALDYQRLR